MQGHTSCSGLTGVVLAQKIAEILHSGDATAILQGLPWETLANTCIIILQGSATSSETVSDDSGSGAEVVETAEEDTTESATETPDAGGRTSKQIQDIIRVFPFTRSFASLDLSSFTVLSSGSTSKCGIYQYQLIYLGIYI